MGAFGFSWLFLAFLAFFWLFFGFFWLYVGFSSEFALLID
jgi:hypothetical protein